MYQQTPIKQNLQFTASDTQATDTDWITANTAASSYDVIQAIVIQNNDAAAQTMTVKVQTYSSSYSAIFTKTYAIAAAASEVITELAGQILNGAATNPDKVTVSFGSAMTGSDTVDCLCSTVRFA